jgi:predicted transcriptional regulator
MDYPKRKREMIALRKARWTLEEIAEKYGLTKQRVGQIIGKQKRGADGKATK